VDFALIMFVALVATGLIWAVDRVAFVPLRRRTAEAMRKSGEPETAIEKAQREPLVVEYARAFFPVILAVFLLRSFLVEPFRIPSGSMMPGLVPGDFILVNKYVYGLRIPVINRKVVDVRSPAHGDVMVFRFPADPSVNYIKRVIGLPGDRVAYRNKQLFINGQAMPQTALGDYTYSESGEHLILARRIKERLDGIEHEILLGEGQNSGELEFVVPEGQYFVMGDNRDRSNDSRYWGTVPEANVVGNAFLIWFSWDMIKGGVAWNRIGSSIH
jgi:signal peptidase I